MTYQRKPFELDVMDMQRHTVELRLALEKAKRRFEKAKMIDEFEKTIRNFLPTPEEAALSCEFIQIEHFDEEVSRKLADFLGRVIDFKCHREEQHEAMQNTLRRSQLHSRRKCLIKDNTMCYFCGDESVRRPSEPLMINGIQEIATEHYLGDHDYAPRINCYAAAAAEEEEATTQQQAEPQSQPTTTATNTPPASPADLPQTETPSHTPLAPSYTPPSTPPAPLDFQLQKESNIRRVIQAARPDDTRLAEDTHMTEDTSRPGLIIDEEPEPDMQAVDLSRSKASECDKTVAPTPDDDYDDCDALNDIDMHEDSLHSFFDKDNDTAARPIGDVPMLTDTDKDSKELKDKRPFGELQRCSTPLNLSATTDSADEVMPPISTIESVRQVTNASVLSDNNPTGLPLQVASPRVGPTVVIKKTKKRISGNGNYVSISGPNGTSSSAAARTLRSAPDYIPGQSTRRAKLIAPIDSAATPPPKGSAVAVKQSTSMASTTPTKHVRFSSSQQLVQRIDGNIAASQTRLAQTASQPASQPAPNGTGQRPQRRLQKSTPKRTMRNR